MSDLTPYDTGERLEPHAWVGSHIRERDDYGKVDFENDESATELMVYVERTNDGDLVVHIEKSNPLAVVRVQIEEDE